MKCEGKNELINQINLNLNLNLSLNWNNRSNNSKFAYRVDWKQYVYCTILYCTGIFYKEETVCTQTCIRISTTDLRWMNFEPHIQTWLLKISADRLHVQYHPVWISLSIKWKTRSSWRGLAWVEPGFWYVLYLQLPWTLLYYAYYIIMQHFVSVRASFNIMNLRWW